MSQRMKKMTACTVSFLAGAGLIAGAGIFNGMQIEPNAVSPAPEALHAETTVSEELPQEPPAEPVSAATPEVKAARTYTAVDIELPLRKDQAKKAALGQYVMLMQIDVPEEKAPENVFEEIPEETPDELPAFDEEYDSDETEVYDIKPDKLLSLGTRSVADEYYSVFDERSGSYRSENCREMLCQMINNEVGSQWGDEAIKAQIVAAYSHLRYCSENGIVPTIGMRDGYDSHIADLVAQVEGQAVFYGGNIANTVYSASTAGYSVESERIWGTAMPYLKCTVSEYDCNDPYYGLETVLSKAEVKAALENACGIVMSDNCENWFDMEDIYSRRYVGYINIDGQARITCRTLQDTFGLQSQAVRVEVDGENVIFRTFGWGHGVGMSQWGARGYSEHGWSYDQILRHYYINTDVRLTEGDTRAEVTDSPEE